MINIRYHIVSITAVFLALGIGVALGSTFLDRATVGRLDDNIRNAEAEIDATKAENDRLSAALASAQERDLGLIAASETLLAGQLTGRPVLLVAAPGVDQATVDTLRLVIGNADADLRGTLALRDGLTFPGEEVDADLAEALGMDGTSTEEAREVAIDALVAALVAAGAPAEAETDGGDTTTTTTTTTPAPGTTGTAESIPEDPATTAPTTTVPGATTPDATTTEPGAGATEDEATGPAGPDGTQPTIVTTLLAADLVDFDPGPDRDADEPILETTGYRYVFVSQPDLAPLADQLLLDLLPATETDPSLPAVVVSPSSTRPTEEGVEPNPTAVDLVRSDADRAALYSTVDDVDTYLGLTTTVTLLGTDEGTSAGHYGQGEGATALAPAGR